MGMSERYTKFLEGLRLRHFEAHEITRYAYALRRGVTNALPPEDLWENIVPVLNILDQFRHHYGAPVRITSSFRSENYNIAVGGARRSQHKVNAACDIQVRGMTPTKVFNRLKKLRDAGCFRGGLGKYGTFVHIDTRGNNTTF